ncbi:MAG TPA: hypothetical protein VHC49_12795 [Mycobacteriales bacterium]|nr:hypothetical protein [Mycobacteriales bacterium]
MSTLLVGQLRRRRTWKVIVLVIVLGLVVLAHNTTPDKGDFLQPVTVAAGSDDVATTPDFAITVDAVQTGGTIAVPSLTSDEKTRLGSSIGWVVVTVTADATKSPISLLGMRIKTSDGRTFLASRRDPLSEVDLGTAALSPELPVRAQVAVEMPASAVPGARFEAAKSSFQALEAVAAVPLPPATHQDVVTMSREKSLPPGPVRPESK